MTLLDQYHHVRRHTEQICGLLQPEDHVPQPVPFVSPPKWHLAHTSWFFEEFLLKPHLPGYNVFNDDFSYLFNSYYNNVGKRVLRNNRGAITRPPTSSIIEYRHYVDMHMELLLQLKAGHDDVHELIELGLNHEQQHQELLYTDIKYILSCNPISPVYNEVIHWEKQHNIEEGFVTVEEGVYEIGFNGDGFSFDNEHNRHKVYLNQFEISKALVTNGEFLEFIDAGGYKDFNLWLDEGWSWVNENQITAPLWKKMRLPTEAEWEVASASLNWGRRWEWTHSAYLPYPGFAKPEGAVGEYNGKFMINQMVLRGASCATPEGHSRTTYRNFFHPDERWQFNGIRLVKR
jgi:ergothioneine biosynthesis protein EgtB